MSLLLLLAVALSATVHAAMSDRVTANASCTYTFEEGQFDTAVNTTISGPVFQYPGNITMTERPFVDWIVTPTVSRQGIVEIKVGVGTIAPSTVAISAGYLRDCGSFLVGDDYTLEFWIKPYTLANTPLPFISLGDPAVSEFSCAMYYAGGQYHFFCFYQTPSSGQGVVTGFIDRDPPDDIYHATITVSPGATSHVVLNMTGSTGLMILDQTRDVAATLSLPTQSRIRYGSGAEGGVSANFPQSLLFAHYCGLLNESQIQQNFIAGYPPSIPYTRINETNGVAETPVFLNFSNFICLDVDSTNVTARILMPPVNGGTISVSITGGDLAPVLSYPFFIPYGGLTYYTGPFNLSGHAADSFTFSVPKAVHSP